MGAVRGAGLSLVSMIALGAAGCCGFLCAPCSLPPTGPPPPIPPLPGLGPTSPAGPSVAAPPGVGATFTAEPTKIRTPGATYSLPKLSLRGSVGAPIRGSLVEVAPGKTRFVLNHALNIAPVGGGTLFVVHASTGLWLHETKSLTRLARLVRPPIIEMAASPDGSQIAFTAGDVLGAPVALRVMGYPDLTIKASAEIDRPHRMRFSPSGDRIVSASYDDTVTLVDAKTGAAQTFDTGQDVNDAIVMPDRPDEVAYASDEDEIVVYDIKAGRKVFGSEPLIDDYQARQGGLLPFIERDQTAVACDPSTLRLIGGGDDNKIWRFDGVRSGAPAVLNPIDFNGNIREILCCSGGSYAVALDTLAVHLMSPKGAIGPSFGPLVSGVENTQIRIALVPDGSVLIAAGGRALRWDPAARSALLSPDYFGAQIDAQSATDADSVFVGCDGKRCAVARAVHAAPAAEIEAAPVGDAPLSSLDALLDYSDGSRALAGLWKGNPRFVFLAPGGTLEPPIDPPGVSAGGSFAARTDKLAHGYLDPSGQVFEIRAAPREVALVGRAPSGVGGRQLEWDDLVKRWKVRAIDGSFEGVGPP